MSSKPVDRFSFGDFQTPLRLAELVWGVVDIEGVTHIVEPTVGLGNFVRAAPPATDQLSWYAFDTSDEYVRAARLAATDLSLDANIRVRNAFELEPKDFPEVGHESIVLVIGNPPWATNAGQGAMCATNLPTKINRSGLAGLAAMTGKANFDIGEAILLAVLSALRNASEVRVALLVKRSVALKVAQAAMGRDGAVGLAFSEIDAQRWFGASVDAGLFQMVWRPGFPSTREVPVFDSIGGEFPVTRAGIVREKFVYRIDDYEAARHLEAPTKDKAMPWRQGLKHDAAKVLELRQTSDGLVNGFGEGVDIESNVLCPLYKSSDSTRALTLHAREARAGCSLSISSISQVPFSTLLSAGPS